MNAIPMRSGSFSAVQSVPLEMTPGPQTTSRVTRVSDTKQLDSSGVSLAVVRVFVVARKRQQMALRMPRHRERRTLALNVRNFLSFHKTITTQPESANQSISNFLRWQKQPGLLRGQLRCEQKKDRWNRKVFSWSSVHRLRTVKKNSRSFGRRSWHASTLLIPTKNKRFIIYNSTNLDNIKLTTITHPGSSRRPMLKQHCQERQIIPNVSSGNRKGSVTDGWQFERRGYRVAGDREYVSNQHTGNMGEQSHMLLPTPWRTCRPVWQSCSVFVWWPAANATQPCKNKRRIERNVPSHCMLCLWIKRCHTMQPSKPTTAAYIHSIFEIWDVKEKVVGNWKQNRHITKLPTKNWTRFPLAMNNTPQHW